MLELKNNAGSSLLVPLAAAGTDVQILTADAAEFPALTIAGDIFRARLRDNAGNYEYVTATARAANHLIIERGAEGTTPRDFPAGSNFELVVTAGSWDIMAENRWTRPRDANRDVLAPTRLSATSFTLPGDLTAMFAPNRALRLHQNAPANGYVASSSYAAGVTTIVVTGCAVDTGLALVELGLEIEAAPKYGNAANADTLNGKTKAEIVAEAQAGTAANASTLSGKTKAEVVAEARSGLLSETGSAAGLTNVSDVSARDIAAMGLLIAAIAAGRGTSGVPKGGIWLFFTDEMTKSGATYDSTNKRYGSTVAQGSTFTPTFTAAATAGYTASGSSNYGSAYPWNAFDRSDGTAFTSQIGATCNLVLSCPSAQSVASYDLRAGGSASNPARAPKDWTLEGSNTGAWAGEQTILDTRTNQTGWSASIETRNYTCASPGNFQFYRLYVTANNGDATYCCITNLELYHVGTVSNMVLATAAGIALGFTPTKATLYLLHKSVDAVVLNTDLKVKVGNGSGAWATATDLAKLCSFDAAYDLLKASIDMTALAAGQTGNWGLDTYNAKQQQVRAALVLFQ